MQTLHDIIMQHNVSDVHGAGTKNNLTFTPMCHYLTTCGDKGLMKNLLTNGVDGI